MAVVPNTSFKEQLMQSIGPEVAKIEHAMRLDFQETTAGADPLLTDVLEYGIFNGGKRLRPLLVVLAARLCGHKNPEKNNESIHQLAIAFEYIHGASLFHDDVIDRADMRRGKPTVNNQFGVIAAILGGDFLLSRSMFLIGTHGGNEALQIFCQATNGMIDGEFLQLRNAMNCNLSEEDYYAVVTGKTALLIAATCEIGALAGGASVMEQKALAEYGISLGTAFQIIDDLLDYQGDPAQTGKAVGNDFQEGKMTLPVILALGTANLMDKKRLLFLLQNENERQSGLDEALQLIEKYDGFGKSRFMAESIITKALSGLGIFQEKSCLPVLEVLAVLAQYVLARKK